MRTRTVNISFPAKILLALDRLARQESRSRSELLRDAALAYVERKERWAKMFSYWNRAAKESGICSEDVQKAIAEYRRNPAKRRSS